MGISVAEVARRFRAAQAGMKQAAVDILQQNEPDIVELKRKQLFEKGIEGYRYKSDAYARKKYAMNKLPGYGVPDGRLTGAFYEGLTAQVTSSGLSLNSTDSKTPYLTKNYPNILKLTLSSKSDIRKNMLQPGLVQYLRRETGAR